MGPTQESSNIPGSAQQQTAAGSVDIISDLMKQAHEADVQAAQSVKLASQPIAGGHQLPGAANLPNVSGHQFYDYDTHPVVGHHNATMRGIVNLSKGVSNLVGSVDMALAQKKTQRLAVNIERLMGAVNSSDQAKQVLQNDPNNAAAKTQLQKATAIQDEILSDQKVRKDIGKAYNINFTDPSKNNTPEHAALKQATESYSQQFQRQLPGNMQQDPQRVAQAQVATAQAKATHDLVNKIAPALIRQQTDLAKAGAQIESREKIARIETAGKIEAEQIRGQNEWRKARFQASQALNRVLVGANEHMRLAAFNQDREDQRLHERLDKDLRDAGGDLTKVSDAALQKRLNEADKLIKDDPQTISSFTQLRDNIQKDILNNGKKSKHNQADLDQANHAIYYANKSLEANQQTQKALQDELDRRQLGKKQDGNTGQQSKPDTTSAPASTKPLANLADVDESGDTDTDESDE